MPPDALLPSGVDLASTSANEHGGRVRKHWKQRTRYGRQVRGSPQRQSDRPIRGPDHRAQQHEDGCKAERRSREDCPATTHQNQALHEHERDPDELEDVHGQKRLPALIADGQQSKERPHREVERVAEQDEEGEPTKPSGDRRREVCVSRPVPVGRNTEGETRQQQKQARCQTPLKLPRVVPGSRRVLGCEKSRDRVPVEHQQDCQRSGKVDEDDAVRVDPRLPHCAIDPLF